MLSLRTATVGLVLLASNKLSLAQTLIDTAKLPNCAVNCATLNSANSGCVPPAAPVTDQGTYQSCFCQSTLLVTLYSTPNGVCDAECTNASDRQQLKDWYVGLCTGGVVVTPGGSQPTATNSGAASTTTAGGRPATGTGKAENFNPEEQTWISGHWQYIVMIIVIFLGLVGLTILAIWLKRRHDRKVDARRSNVAAADASFVSLPPNMVAASHSNSPRGSAFWRNSAAGMTSTSMVGGAAPPAAMGAVGRPDSRTMYRQSGGAGSGTWGRSRSGTANSSVYPPITSPQLMQAQTRGYEYPDVEPAQSQASLRNVASWGHERPMGRSMEKVGEGIVSETYAGEDPPQTDRPRDI